MESNRSGPCCLLHRLHSVTASIDNYLDRLDELDEDTQARVKALTRHLGELAGRRKSEDDFIHFVRQVWPAFIEGHHHRLMADAFKKVARITQCLSNANKRAMYPSASRAVPFKGTGGPTEVRPVWGGRRSDGRAPSGSTEEGAVFGAPAPLRKGMGH